MSSDEACLKGTERAPAVCGQALVIGVSLQGPATEHAREPVSVRHRGSTKGHEGRRTHGGI